MKKLLPFALCLVVLFLSSCTEAKRFLDDKTDAKAKPTPHAIDPSIPLKSSPSPATTAVATFSGDVAGKAGKRLLYQLLEKNNKTPIKLDLLLSDDQLQQLTVEGQDKWYFDLAYQGEDGYNTGGELFVDITKGKGDLKLNGNHLTGNIVVTNQAGPTQGLMSIRAKPLMGESAEIKKDAPKPSPSILPEGKKKAASSSNPPI